MAKGLILLVEDEATTREVFSQALNRRGYTVATAADGNKAIALLHRHTPRVIVLDINLPGMDGKAVCKRARIMLQQHVPILFLTSADGVETFRECLEAGGDDFLLKAGSIATILERIDQWASGRARGLTEAQRQRVLNGAGAGARPPSGGPPDAAAPPASPMPAAVPPPVNRELDEAAEILKRVVDFVRRAYSMSEPDFGATPDQRLYFIGYVAAVFNMHALSNLTLKMRFVDSLKSIFGQVGSVAPGDVDRLVAAWETTHRQPIFMAGCERGEHDFRNSRMDDPNWAPPGLAAHRQAG